MPESNLDRWASEVERQSRGSVWAGLALTLAFHVLALAIMFLALRFGPFESRLPEQALTYFGLIQLVYMIPAILFFRRRGDTETGMGLIIGASLTFLLNAACDGLIFQYL